MSKRQRMTEKSGGWCFTYYDFIQNEYDNVIQLENLIGCSTMINSMTVEIGNVITNPSIYEITQSGKLPVFKFMRFYGCKNSSKLTAILSFACNKQINTI